MLVRIARGTTAAGWLYVCTGGTTFVPVYGPLPSKPQLDALEVDAATLGGVSVEALRRKALIGGIPDGPGALVVDGDAGTTAPYRVRGLLAGADIRLQAEGTDAVRIHGSTAGVVCVLRLADVVATGGPFVVRTQGAVSTMPSDWPIEWAALERPALMYVPSMSTSVPADVVFLSHDLPTNGGGFDLQATVVAAEAGTWYLRASVRSIVAHA